MPHSAEIGPARESDPDRSPQDVQVTLEITPETQPPGRVQSTRIVFKGNQNFSFELDVDAAGQRLFGGEANAGVAFQIGQLRYM